MPHLTGHSVCYSAKFFQETYFRESKGQVKATRKTYLVYPIDSVVRERS